MKNFYFGYDSFLSFYCLTMAKNVKGDGFRSNGWELVLLESLLLKAFSRI